MNCNDVQEKIGQLVFEQNEDMLKEVDQHIQDCTKCSLYFNDSFQNAELFRKIQKAEPVLKEPEELTNAILSGIENLEQENPASTNRNSTKLLPLYVKLLAAASICLLLVLGVEQYKVVTKVRTLEATLNNVSGNSTYAAQSSGFMLQDASKLNSGLISFMLTRNNNGILQTALNYQSERLSKKTNTQQQNIFLNSKIYKLIGN